MVPADTGKVGGGEEQMEVLKGVDVRCATQPTPLRSARVRHRAQVPQVAHSPLFFGSRRQHSHTLAGTGQRQAPGILSASPACRRQRTAARNAATRTSWSPSTTRWAYARASLRRSHAPCVGGMSQPTPARARVFPFVESQTTWNAERKGGASLDPV